MFLLCDLEPGPLTALTSHHKLYYQCMIMVMIGSVTCPE